MLAELAVVVKTRLSEQKALATFGWPALVMSAFQSDTVDNIRLIHHILLSQTQALRLRRASEVGGSPSRPYRLAGLQ
jgi:hypothetical protein